MGFYYAREKKKFDAEWEKTAAWYKSEGMSDEDIEKMRLFPRPAQDRARGKAAQSSGKQEPEAQEIEKAPQITPAD